jgi:uncharacterized protein with gpF-like domain
MRYNLARMAPNKRRAVTIRDIRPPAVMATDLYRAAYMPVIDAWASYIPRFIEEYERSLAAITTDSPADISEDIAKAEREIGSLQILLGLKIKGWVGRIESWQRGKWVSGVLTATSVNVSTMLGADDVRDTLEGTIARNVELVKDVSAQAQSKMAGVIFDGLRNRTPARAVAKQLREVVDLGKARSIRIASDQLGKLTSALADERRREAGLMYWTWLHSGKLHPRQEHLARNGNLYSDDPKGVGKTIDGDVAMTPPEDRPGQLPFCGCRSLSVIDWGDDG